MYSTSWYTRQWTTLLLTCFLFIIGLSLFWKGFFGAPNTLTGFSTTSDIKFPYDLCGIQPAGLPDPREDHLPLKLVFVLIDALRYEFIKAPQFQFVNSLLAAGGALLFRSRTYSPTVTLPRVKTLITGTVPGFSDLLVNLNAKELQGDNFIHQAYSSGKKISFYGDNTWLKILPHHFHRHDGTSSFFVSDYTEVDHNVSRHIPSELKASDWDMLILHYLGLDHIGHSHGPASPLIGKKLSEMDNILKLIYERLRKRERENFLVVITGDHGMSRTGSHGGVSENEIMTPLVFIPTQKWTLNQKPPVSTVSQVDIAATLSLLLGLPIPKCSCGVMLSDIFHSANYSSNERLFLMQYNLHQVYRVYQYQHGSEAPLSDKAKATLCSYLNQSIYSHYANSKDCLQLEGEFHSVMSEIRDVLLRSTGFNMNLVLTGTSATWLSSLTLFLAFLGTNQRLPARVPRFTATNAVLSITVSLFQHCILCAAFPSAESCRGVFLGLFILLSAVAVCLLCAFLHLPFGSLTNCEMTHSLIPLVTIFHAATFASSSFIEEEHLTWYFLTATVTVVLSYKLFWRTIDQDPWVLIRRACCILLLLRILRSWNSTGYQWGHLPDTADWLAEAAHKPVLAILILAGIIAVILASVRRDRPLYSFFFYLALLDICFYKLKFIFYEDSTGVENLYWYIPLLIAVGLLHRLHGGSRYDLLVSFVDSWSLLSFVLHFPQNTPMFALIIILERTLNNFLSSIKVSVPLRTAIYYWYGMSSFFNQGNSNSMSTISVAAGYVGVSDYSPFIVGLLMFCHTYSGFAYWLLMLWTRIAEPVKDGQAPPSFGARIVVFNLLVLLKFGTTAWYLVLMIIQRYHLFVQSVFSPKLAYECAHCVAILLLTITPAIILT